MKLDLSQKPKLLFIALADSTHTHAWIDLTKKLNFDICVFAVNYTQAPKHFKTPTYSMLKSWPSLNISRNYNFRGKQFFFHAAKLILRGKCFEEFWLAQFIKKWKPDVIHTLGLNPASYILSNISEKFSFKKFRWVVTARGGPELALDRLISEKASKISEVMQKCDFFIADNLQNYDYALSLGLAPQKISSLHVVPGTGGVNIEALSKLGELNPSKRERIIVWPKAYECPASKALPVLEAIQLCWDRIKPCEIYLTALIPEVRMWFNTLSEEIQKSCHLYERIPRAELLTIMAKSRVLLIPSLIDGIPNCLYEAMATKTFPVVSPISTIKNVVNEDNVLFARNLYPEEIANALVKAMNDDELVDSAAEKNLSLVSRIANRSTIEEKVLLFYQSLVEGY